MAIKGLFKWLMALTIGMSHASVVPYCLLFPSFYLIPNLNETNNYWAPTNIITYKRKLYSPFVKSMVL